MAEIEKVVLGSEIDDAHVLAYRDVIVGTSEITEPVKGEDPFAQDAEVFKTYDGLSDTSKKRAYRAFKKVHEGEGGAKSSKLEGNEQFVTGYQILDVVLPPHNLDYLARLYTLSSPHFAAVNVKTANIVGLGYDFIDSHKTQDALDATTSEEARAKKVKKVRALRSEMYDWIDSCNKEDEFLETLNKIYIDYESTGNGYMEIGRKNNGEIGYLGHIPSTTMRVRRKRDGFVQIAGQKAQFFKHFGDTKTTDPIGESGNKVNEVIHFKKYSPTNSYYGIPDIIAASQAVAGMEFAGRFNLDYFENKAVPRYVVVVKGGQLGKAAQKSIVEFFETGLRGQNHRTLFVPLPADTQEEKVSFEMKPIEAGTQDASFVNYDKINLASIFMAHRTPASKTGYNSGQNLAAARDADKTFKEGVCRPEQKKFEKKFARVIKEKTDMFTFKLTELTLTDEDTQSKIDERELRMQVVTPNEVRTRKGMPGRKGGDKVVDLKAQDKAEQTAQAQQSRTRDANRSAGATDSAGEGRNAKGDGRSTA